MIEAWSKIRSQLLGDYRIFQLRRDTSRSPRTGKAHDFFVLDTGDWINIIPVTAQGQVVLIRQYRHGTEEVTLEIPGGMVDGSDPSPQAAAEREMLEETGYAAEEVVHLGSVTPNPAILSNRCHSFLARGARQVAPPRPEGTEEIELELAELEEIPGLIAAGAITHALTIAAFYFHDRYQPTAAQE
ncbi:MAG: NUDIX hydrolase [Candidatus Promineifilaceae bacterium]|nr:NUDIX hydrolase [Candidatus Promineifilaceae bacterium]